MTTGKTIALTKQTFVGKVMFLLLNNLFQYSCLENSMDRGAWWVPVHGGKELDMTEVTKGDQSWVFIGRNDAKAETPILWLPHVNS